MWSTLSIPNHAFKAKCKSEIEVDSSHVRSTQLGILSLQSPLEEAGKLICGGFASRLDFSLLFDHGFSSITQERPSLCRLTVT